MLKILISGVAMLATTGVASAQQFGAPVVLAQGLIEAYSSSAIDPNGNAVVAWVGVDSNDVTTASASYRPAHGKWSAPVAVATLGYGLPINVRMTADGHATVVASDASNIWSIDMAPGGVWGSPAVIATGSGPADLAMDTDGDEAVVYGSPFDLMAIRRKAGSSHWGAPQTVVAQSDGNYTQLDGAAEGAGGDLLISWENYNLQCSPICFPSDYVLYASRETRPGSGWLQPVELLPLSPDPLSSAPVVDAHHRAGVIFGAPGTSTPIEAETAGPSGIWGQVQTVFGAVSPNAYPSLMGTEVDATGHASVGLMQVGSPGEVTGVDGTIDHNHWGGPRIVSKSDKTVWDEVAYGSASSATNGLGGLALTWADADGRVRVRTRLAVGTPWGSLQTANRVQCGQGLTNCNAAQSIAMNATGQEVTTWNYQASLGEPLTLSVAVTK